MRRLGMKRALLVIVCALASLGVGRCDPNRACPTGMQAIEGVTVEDVIAALKAGNVEEPLCECRPGYELNNPSDWTAGCHAVETPTPTPAPIPTVEPTATPTSPVATPTATPSPAPTPEPTPAPTPEPGVCGGGPPNCITIDVRCAGGTACGIPTSAKNPQLRPGDYKLVLDASYCRNNPWNKVHDFDPCYPGPIQSWEQRELMHWCDDPECHVDCNEPISTPGLNPHLLTCGRFDFPSKTEFTACGHGVCGSSVVKIR
jgi:hypothetical protein